MLLLGRHHGVVEWAQTAAIVGALTAVSGVIVGLQSFWIARSFDALRSEMYRGFDAVDRRFDAVDRRFDAVDGRFDTVEQRLDRLEGREPPTLRTV